MACLFQYLLCPSVILGFCHRLFYLSCAILTSPLMLPAVCQPFRSNMLLTGFFRIQHVSLTSPPRTHAGGIRGKSLVMHWHVCLDDSHRQLPAVMQLVTNWNPGTLEPWPVSNRTRLLSCTDTPGCQEQLHQTADGNLLHARESPACVVSQASCCFICNSSSDVAAWIMLLLRKKLLNIA